MGFTDDEIAEHCRIIEVLGGASAIVRHMRRFDVWTTRQTVCNWRKRGIPYGARTVLLHMADWKDCRHELPDNWLPGIPLTKVRKLA